MAVDPGKDFSLSKVLHPWPVECFHILLDVLGQVQEPLASVFLQRALTEERGLSLSTNQIGNVAWKVGTYFPSLLTLRYPPGCLSSRLKAIQQLAPDEATVRIPPCEGRCRAPGCPGTLRVKSSVVASTHTGNLSSGSSGAHGAAGNRFKFYSLNAGIQHASFAESVCEKCRRIYLGTWSYRRNAAATGTATYGRMSDIQYVGATPELKYVVVPREYSFYAVETSLLQSMTDQMTHSGANFTSAVRVWAGQHRERCQARLIVGEDNTMEKKTRDALLQAWCVWHVVRLCPRHLPDERWCFTPAGFDETLQRCQPALRAANLERCVQHARECPRCKTTLLVLGDGKRGACRYICAGTEGSVKYEDLRAAVYSGCRQHVGGGALLCRACRPSTTPQEALIPQRRVLQTEVMEDEESGSLTTRYLVECENPWGGGEVFQCLLPRREVKKELLQTFEERSLPLKSDPKTKLQKPPSFKSAKQKLLWYKSARGTCNPVRVAKRQAPLRQARKRGASQSGLQKRQGEAKKAKSKASSAPHEPKVDEQPSQRGKSVELRRLRGKGTEEMPKAVKGRGKASKPMRKGAKVGNFVRQPAGRVRSWLYDHGGEVAHQQSCNIDKANAEEARRRRCSGGIVTAVFSCGYLADWQELWRGESIEVMYLFFLRLYKDFKTLGLVVDIIGYDNACRLLAFARKVKDQQPPWTSEFADSVKMVLDNFHKGNHTWCLANLPEVNPDSVQNAKLLEGKNTEACEQLNSWIARHTSCCLEMRPGVFGLYWWAMLSEHNAWLEWQAQCRRRRFLAGRTQRNPDTPHSRREDGT